jgi:methyl-accepting chemotaxis protein
MSFNNLSFNQRLTITVLVPLLAFVITIGYLIQQSASSAYHAKVIQTLPEFSSYASALIHNLQVERGLSAGYLGSKGENFASQLTSHRSKTDEKLVALNKYLDSHIDQPFFDVIRAEIKSVRTDLTNITTTRNQVQGLIIPVKNAVGYYSGIIRSLLLSIETAAATTDDATISRETLALVSFMNIKERAGIIRAVLANTFAANKFKPGMRDKLVNLIAEQNTYIDKFKVLTTEDHLNVFIDSTKSNVYNDSMEMRNKALANEGGNFGIAPSQWFKLQTEKINKLKEIEELLTHSVLTHAEEATDHHGTILIWHSVLSFLVITFTAGLIFSQTKRLTRETNLMSEVLTDISEGALSADKYPYETPSFNALTAMQRKLIMVNQSIQEVTHTVGNSAKEIAESNKSLAKRAEDQAVNLEKTASSMEEITATVKLNAENLQNGNRLANDAQQHATSGKVIVSKAVAAMNEINEDSKKIAEIIKLIDEIAFQTNLLALNAAVEAARAGEQGRGFAVVASEVRHLAQRSAEAAHEIKVLIEESVLKINSGSKLVNESGDSLEEIVGAVTNVSKIISEIATSGEEQAIGIGQINDSITRLDEVNQKNAAMVEEVAVSSNILEEQSRELEQLISFYRLNKSKSEFSQTANVPQPPPLKKQEKATPTASTNEQKEEDGAWEAFG